MARLGSISLKEKEVQKSEEQRMRHGLVLRAKALSSKAPYICWLV